jgi:bifunctional non-homologous end joining protein LigD
VAEAPWSTEPSPALSALRPMLARDAKRPPEGPEWAFEVKWDGVRALAIVESGELRIVSRSGEDVTARYPELAGIGAALGGRDAVLDGEIVALDERDRPSFQLLQRRMGLTSPQRIRARVAEAPVTYMAFDLLHLDGRSTLALPYLERRELLEGLELAGPHWQAPRHHLGDGAALLEAARRQGLEGVVAKRRDSPYRPGRRSSEWVKTRIRRRQDFLIGGWMPGAGGRSGRIGSLLVGFWDATPAEAERLGRPQRLVYAGGVGSGFTERTRDDLMARLEPLRREASPFELGIGPKRPGPRFCEPRLVCAVEFTEWTREGTLRQPAYKGLRDDVDPREIVRE